MARFLVFEKHVKGLDQLIPVIEDLLGEKGHHIINYHQLERDEFVSLTEKDGQPVVETTEGDFSIEEMKKLAVVESNILQVVFGGNSFHQSLVPLMEQHAPDFLMIGPFEDAASKTSFLSAEMRPLLKQVSCPIFFSGREYEKMKFERVVFASDLSKEDQENFRELLGMVHWENKKLDLLTIDTAQYFTQPDVVMREVIKDMAAEARMQQVETHFLEHSSVQKGILTFLDEHNADLLVMCNHAYKKLKHNLWGNALEDIVHKANIPMLIIND